VAGGVRGGMRGAEPAAVADRRRGFDYGALRRTSRHHPPRVHGIRDHDLKELNVDDRQAFLTAIEANPLDHLLRCRHAAWLDEHDGVEEATRQREWVGAYEYLLTNFANPYGVSEEEPPDPAEVLQVIEYWQRSLVEDGEICFVTTRAAENLHDE